MANQSITTDSGSGAPTSPLPPPSNLPKAEPSSIPVATGTGDAPPDSEFKGTYYRTDGSDSNAFALATVSEDLAVNGRTHFLKNTSRFDNVTKEEFKQKYEKR